MSKRYGFQLLPRYSLLDLGGALAVLRQANQLLGGRAIDTLLLSRDGRPVAAAGGEQLLISQALTATVVAIDGLFVIGDAPPQASDEPWLRQHLAVAGQRIAQARGVLGGIGGGALWWAQAGLLDGYRCSASTTPGPPPAFGGALLSSRYCEIDRNRLSCAGGACTLDLMIQWLSQEHGEQLGRQLMAHFGQERLRGGERVGARRNCRFRQAGRGRGPDGSQSGRALVDRRHRRTGRRLAASTRTAVQAASRHPALALVSGTASGARATTAAAELTIHPADWSELRLRLRRPFFQCLSQLFWSYPPR